MKAMYPILLVFLALLLCGQQANRNPVGNMPYRDALAFEVTFWKNVFARLSRDQYVIHDSEHLEIVYQTVSFDSATGPEKREEAIEKIKENIRSRLKELAQAKTDTAGLQGWEQTVPSQLRALGEEEPFAGAARRLRAQQGIKESFLAGVRRSFAYLPYIRKVFRDNGLPEELIYLPHVESSFQPSVVSHVGAAGMWQFMPATARGLMKVNKVTDERFDPLSATHGAAKLLKYNYGQLKDWALTLTSYNHGLGSMRKAKKRFGTDYMKIRENYLNRSFGFASKNFYPEFLAVVEMMDSAEVYFPGLPRDEVLVFREIVLPSAASLPAIANAHAISVDELKKLNGGFRREVWQGESHIPQGYRLRLPMQVDADAVLAALPQGKTTGAGGATVVFAANDAGNPHEVADASGATLVAATASIRIYGNRPTVLPGLAASATEEAFAFLPDSEQVETVVPAFTVADNASPEVAEPAFLLLAATNLQRLPLNAAPVPRGKKWTSDADELTVSSPALPRPAFIAMATVLPRINTAAEAAVQLAEAVQPVAEPVSNTAPQPAVRDAEVAAEDVWNDPAALLAANRTFSTGTEQAGKPAIGRDLLAGLRLPVGGREFLTVEIPEIVNIPVNQVAEVPLLVMSETAVQSRHGKPGVSAVRLEEKLPRVPLLAQLELPSVDPLRPGPDAAQPLAATGIEPPVQPDLSGVAAQTTYEKPLAIVAKAHPGAEPYKIDPALAAAFADSIEPALLLSRQTGNSGWLLPKQRVAGLEEFVATEAEIRQYLAVEAATEIARQLPALPLLDIHPSLSSREESVWPKPGQSASRVAAVTPRNSNLASLALNLPEPNIAAASQPAYTVSGKSGTVSSANNTAMQYAYLTDHFPGSDQMLDLPAIERLVSEQLKPRNDVVIVYPDETVGHLAEWLNTSVTRLRTLNNLRNGSSLRTGQRLTVEFSRESAEAFHHKREQFHAGNIRRMLGDVQQIRLEEHTIRPGENLWTLARKRVKFPVNLLLYFNDLDKLGQLYPGDVIKLPVTNN